MPTVRLQGVTATGEDLVEILRRGLGSGYNVTLGDLAQERRSFRLAIGLGVLLAVLDVAGWRITSLLFDRERLVTASK